MRNLLRNITGTRVLALLFALVLLALCALNMGTVLAHARVVANNLAEDKDIHVSKEIASFTEDYREAFFAKYDFIELNGLAHRALGQREMNERYLMRNGHLGNSVRRKDMTDYASAMATLHAMLDWHEIPMLYVQTPTKIDPRDDQLPRGITTYANENTDSFLSGIAAEGISALDLRQSIREDGLDHYSLFYKTDHHWTSETGFWAFGKIAERMEAEFGIAVDARVTDRTQYYAEDYPSIMLGSSGKRTGRLFARTLDDMRLIIPSFETWISRDITSKGGTFTEGTFSDVTFTTDPLTYDYYAVSPYAAYATAANVTYRNEDARSKERILIVTDSFGRVVIPYFYLSFAEVEVVDVRNYRARTLLEVATETQPDLVVFIYSPTILMDNKGYRFM